MSVSIQKTGDIAYVTIDNPPVNALSTSVRQGIHDAVKTTEADAEIRTIVLSCAGRTFFSGADVREFGQPPIEPFLPDVVRTLAEATKPWIAAIHGSALGGGLEIALACRFRIATADARLGFPEVNIGTVPGAGGTTMLPRVLSAEAALDMIASGKPVSAKSALASGLIDEIVTDDLLDAATRFAQTKADAPRQPIFDRAPNAISDPDAFEKTAASIAKKAKGQNSPKEAVRLIRNALTLPLDAALAEERITFLRLRDDPQGRALRHIFFAERSAGKSARLKGVSPKPLHHIGVIGGGTMGAGIAAACLLSGLKVTMIERNAEAVAGGRERVEGILNGSLKRGLLTDQKHATVLAAFSASDDYAALGAADLVIEAVFEDMSVKKEVFAQLDAATRPDAVLASNTSYLDVNEIAASVKDPSRVIGLHFFSPAHIMKLLEIVVPAAVSDEALATGVALAKTLKKIPVLAGVCDGFIANRIMSAYRRECEYMLEDGALPWDIDAAMTAFGLPMGIYQMQDLAGLDIAWAMRKRQAATRDPSERYVDIADKLCEAGRLGRKTGRGWYIYEDGASRPDPEVEALILAESARKGITRQPFSAEQIIDRILSCMQATGEKILAEGFAESAADIDVVMVNAFGFPRWKGGPMFLRNAKA